MHDCPCSASRFIDGDGGLRYEEEKRPGVPENWDADRFCRSKYYNLFSKGKRLFTTGFVARRVSKEFLDHAKQTLCGSRLSPTGTHSVIENVPSTRLADGIYESTAIANTFDRNTWWVCGMEPPDTSFDFCG